MLLSGIPVDTCGTGIALVCSNPSLSDWLTAYRKPC